jgi:hypothetical protein
MLHPFITAKHLAAAGAGAIALQDLPVSWHTLFASTETTAALVGACTTDVLRKATFLPAKALLLAPSCIVADAIASY